MVILFETDVFIVYREHQPAAQLTSDLGLLFLCSLAKKKRKKKKGLDYFCHLLLITGIQIWFQMKCFLWCGCLSLAENWYLMSETVAQYLIKRINNRLDKSVPACCCGWYFPTALCSAHSSVPNRDDCKWLWGTTDGWRTAWNTRDVSALSLLRLSSHRTSITAWLMFTVGSDGKGVSVCCRP